MGKVQRLCVKRRSCRTSITKLLTKVEDVILCELNTINSETVDESRRLAFTTMLGHLRTKRVIIIKLDSDICDSIHTEGDLETELNDTDSYLTELEEKIAVVEEYVKKASQPPVTPKQDSHTLMSHPPSNTDMRHTQCQTQMWLRNQHMQ